MRTSLERGVLETLADDVVLATARLTGLTFFAGLFAYATVRLLPFSSSYLTFFGSPLAFVSMAFAVALAWNAMSDERRTRSFLQLGVVGCTLGAFLEAVGPPLWASAASCVAVLVVLLATKRMTLYAASAVLTAFGSVAAAPCERTSADSSVHTLAVIRASLAAAVVLVVLFRALDTRGNKRLLGVSCVTFGIVLGGAGALPDSGVPPNDFMSAVIVLALGAASLREGFRREAPGA